MPSSRQRSQDSKADQQKFKRSEVQYTDAVREFSVFKVLFDACHAIIVHLLRILRYFRTLALTKKWASSCRRPGQASSHVAWPRNASNSQAVVRVPWRGTCESMQRGWHSCCHRRQLSILHLPSSAMRQQKIRPLV